MKTKTIVILVLIVLAVVLVIQNSAMVELQIFFWKIIMSRIIFMVGLLAVGFALGFLATKLKKKS
ncbi:MAG: LapA family protein [Candidatus Aminicenantes bacterium]|nr:LapA family protein [Candidatus Aminicenantes bacterium]